MSYQTDKFIEIADAIRQKKGTTNKISANNFKDEILSIPTGGGSTSPAWVRPADRPTPPTIAENEQVVYELFGVSEKSPNDNAFRMSTSTGQYRVDWGDGVIEDYNSNTTAEHIYDFENLDIEVSSEGYKWVWVKITPITSNLTIVNFHQYRHSLRPTGASNKIFIPQVFEVYMRGSEITSLPNDITFYTRFRLCEVFHFYGAHKINTLSYFCCDYTNLKSMVADINNVTGYFMYNCYSYNQQFPAGVTFDKASLYFMYNCFSYNQPFPAGVTFNKATANFMQYCNSYNQPFPTSVTFNNISDYFMQHCSSYNQPFPTGVTFNKASSYFISSCSSYNQPFPAGITFDNISNGFMQFCSSYNQPFPSEVTFSNVTANFMQSCFSYNQPFPVGITFDKATSGFMNNCSSYNQSFPEGVAFNSVTTNFMQSCNSYNQQFPTSVTFDKATSGFMNNCSSYNQPFPAGVTFNNISDFFMQNCYSYNQPLIVYLQNTSAIGTSFIGSSCYALKSLRLIGMGVVHTALTISSSSLDVPALVALFGDLYDRSATTAGTITITNVYGASRLTPEQRAIATSKKWTIVG